MESEILYAETQGMKAAKKGNWPRVVFWAKRWLELRRVCRWEKLKEGEPEKNALNRQSKKAQGKKFIGKETTEIYSRGFRGPFFRIAHDHTNGSQTKKEKGIND